MKIIEQLGSICKPIVSMQGLREFGVPEGGPLDDLSYELARTLARNSSEIYEISGSLTFELNRTSLIGICGAEVSLDKAITKDRTWGLSAVLHSNSALTIRPCGEGTYYYLAIGETAEQAPPLFLSQSSPSMARGEQIRVTRLGSEPTLEDHGFVITALRNRMGMRLSGLTGHTLELPSQPTCPGVIQWTPSGEIIILGPDGPTLGGYPKLGTVIAADRSRLAQLHTGRKVRFQFVTFNEARSLHETSTGALSRRIHKIQSHLAERN